MLTALEKNMNMNSNNRILILHSFCKINTLGPNCSYLRCGFSHKNIGINLQELLIWYTKKVNCAQATSQTISSARAF